MSPFWQRRVGDSELALAWQARARAAVAAARVLADQGFLPEAVALAATAIAHAARAALAHAGAASSADLDADFEGLIRARRLEARFAEVLAEARAWRARTEQDPSWSPPGDEARIALARATAFLNGIQVFLER